MNEKLIGSFWQRAKKALDFPERLEYDNAYSFGDSSKEADRLGRLVIDRIKAAASSSYDICKKEGGDLPKTDQLDIILGSDKPLAVISNYQVMVVKFSEVDQRQAYLEGEGDRSLSNWQNIHRPLFKKEYKSNGLEFTDDSKLILERFHMLYSEDPDK
ncbi:ASCH domain-containing protein [Oenococcus alcoholitolerans]|uniref:ASCH domain-containing protein n=1 Tax=Oenococcus alcoholitolerans TaxID=931074 RepID=UPI003F7222EB